MRLLALTAILMLAACGSSQVLSQNPSGVSFKYDPLLSSQKEVEKQAVDICAKYGKKAVLENTNQHFVTDWKNISFSCR
ncbi:MAG: hypothetical protein ACK5QX_12455 [bacterium]